jgi:hypothetical protein
MTIDRSETFTQPGGAEPGPVERTRGVNADRVE